VLALALQETLFVIAWGALGGALFLPITHLWYYAVPPVMLAAIFFLVLMELSGDANPLISLEIRQHSSGGAKKISRSAAYFRILFTIILFPPALAGYIPLLFGKLSLPELLTGTRLISIDRQLDPRPESAINWINKRAKIRVRTLTYVPMAAAASVFILLYSAPHVISVPLQQHQTDLPYYEQELLTHYLELVSLHPEELEYHVRLASLYYRNNMLQDLETELAIIRGIDPGHAILILADTASFNFGMLEPVPGDSSAWADFPAAGISPLLSADSITADSTATVLSDSLSASHDSTGTGAAADTTVIIEDYSSPTVTDTIPESPQSTVHEEPELEPAGLTKAFPIPGGLVQVEG
jgi:hypothetical protein